MKARHVVLGVFLLLLVGGGVALYQLYNSLDGIVKSTIEKQGTALLGVPVRVGSVQISLGTGAGTIRGLRVANPAGFPSGDAFSLGEISLDLDLSSVTGSPIVIESVVIAAPAASVVLDAKGRTNLEVIQKNLGSQSSQSGSEPSSAGGASPLLRIDRFSFSKGEVSADMTAQGGKVVKAALPELSLREVGGKSGSTADAIGSTIASAFTRAVSTAVARAGAGALIDKHLKGQEGEAAKQLLDRFLK